MEDNFQLIYFTAPEAAVLTQAMRINAVLGWGGFAFAHLRMPGATKQTLKEVIELIDPELRPRLVLHDSFSLAEEYGCGVQINSHSPSWWDKGPKSASCHSPEDAHRWLQKGCRYVTLSPIFPSISKPGYQADFSHYKCDCRGIIALGGVDAGKLKRAEQMGFSGAAILGWLDVPFPEFCRRLKLLKMIAGGKFSLQYITNGTTPEEVAQEVHDVLAGGGMWVQIRMKDAPDEAVARAAALVVPMCKRVGAICLLDDRVHLVEPTGADGVHLGKNDMSPAEAADILGATKIIGSTANSLADICHILDQGASDYIGCGPYRFTTTKKNLAPVLGLDGYREIFATNDGRELPIVAIGGIEKEDIPDILATGASGVAISGAIYRAANRKEATREICRKISGE